MKPIWIAVISAVTLLLGCSDADTLGDEPPVEVIIAGTPTFENGIGGLLALKCGYCHVYPLGDLSPSNIVADLDLNVYDTRVVDDRVIRGADSVGSWIYYGILNHPVTMFEDTSDPRRMPLDYGTPVTAREVSYLEEWVAMGSPRNDQPEPQLGDPNNGAALYLAFPGCVDCHGLGEGFAVSEGRYLGPPLRDGSVTNAKIKSMWLHKINATPISDEEASDIRAYIATFPKKER